MYLPKRSIMDFAHFMTLIKLLNLRRTDKVSLGLLEGRPTALFSRRQGPEIILTHWAT